MSFLPHAACAICDVEAPAAKLDTALRLLRLFATLRLASEGGVRRASSEYNRPVVRLKEKQAGRLLLLLYEVRGVQCCVQCSTQLLLEYSSALHSAACCSMC
jgi:hypothetical protein